MTEMLETLLQACIAFLKIGAFSFGGGYAVVAFIQREVVEGHSWITPENFVNVVAIAEMTPGPIAVNSSTFVGTRIGGTLGAFVATFGCILPSCLIVSLLAWLYFRYRNLSYIQGTLQGLRPAIVALIASAGLSILTLALQGASGINWLGALLFLAAFLVLRRFKTDPIYVMLGCGVLGGILYPLLDKMV